MENGSYIVIETTEKIHKMNLLLWQAVSEAVTVNEDGLGRQSRLHETSAPL